MVQNIRIDPEFDIYLRKLKKNIKDITGRDISDKQATKFLARSERKIVMVIKKRSKKKNLIERQFEFFDGF